MTRENLTRDEIIEQIAEYNWDQLCEDYTFSATDLLINGCIGLNSYTDDELYAVWDHYFGDDEDDDDELIEVLDRYIANNDDSE